MSNRLNPPNPKQTTIILCLYSPTHAPEYVSDYSAQCETWASSIPETLKVFWVVGNPEISSAFIRNNLLYVKCIDSDILKKTLEALRFVNSSFKYDYVVRTNTSTYFCVDSLHRLIQKLSRSEVDFAGFPLGISLRKRRNFGIYCSGAGLVLSHKAGEYLANVPIGHSNFPDDVAISKLLSERFGTFYIGRSDLEFMPFFWKTWMVRAKNPLNSFSTAQYMYLLHHFFTSSGFKKRCKSYLSLYFLASDNLSKLEPFFPQYSRKFLISIKTLTVITFNRISYKMSRLKKTLA